MEKFIPYEKLSKKEKKRRNAMRRGSWYGINPVTRKPANSKAYSKRKAGKWYDPTDLPFFILRFLRCPCFRPPGDPADIAGA